MVRMREILVRDAYGLIVEPTATLSSMARLDILGGFYLILARGNRRATIFHDDVDYHAHQERLERYRQRDGVTCMPKLNTQACPLHLI